MNNEEKLRKWVVEKVLDYHKANNADTKRIKQDCEMIYEFIIKFKL